MVNIHLNPTQQHIIFDGADADIFQKIFQFECEGIFFQFTLSELEKNEFEDFSYQPLKEKFIAAAQLTQVNFIISFFKTRQGLRLYYWQTDTRVFLFSAGEYQPGRFQCCFEYALDYINNF